MTVFEYSKGKVGDLQQIAKEWNQIYANEIIIRSSDYQTQLAFKVTLNKTHNFAQLNPFKQRLFPQLNQCVPAYYVDVQSSCANILLNMAVYECYEGEVEDLQQIADHWDQIYPYEKYIHPSDHNSQLVFNATLKKAEVFFQRYPLNLKPLPLLNQLETTAYVQKHKIKAIAERARNLGIISFYDDQTDHLTGCFGNFHICPKIIQFEGKNYSNSEAIYQAQKQKDNRHIFDQFDENTDGGTAWHLGQSLLSLAQVRKWDFKKDATMMNCLRAKFDQNPNLKALLMATGNAYLIKHLPSLSEDNYWSDGYDGSGKNNLGICLMKLRAEYGGTGIVLYSLYSKQLLEKFYTKFYAKNASRIDEKFYRETFK